MASFRKVGKRWRAEVRKLGEYHSGTFSTKARAQSWAAEKELQIAKGVGDADYTLADACQKYSRDVSGAKKGVRWERIFLNAFCRNPLSGKPLRAFTRVDMAQWRDDRLLKVRASTVNRELNLLSSVFQAARLEWGWGIDNPVREIKRPPRPKPRNRRPTDDEIDGVLIALGFDGQRVETKSQEVAVMFLLAIESAMRLGEMCGIAAENINFEKRYVALLDTKNGDRRDVPLSSRAVELLRLCDGFSVGMESASALFRKACKRAGILDLHFHDSRREALTRLSTKVDVMDLAKISGHKDVRILLNTYYAPKASDLAKLLD